MTRNKQKSLTALSEIGTFHKKNYKSRKIWESVAALTICNLPFSIFKLKINNLIVMMSYLSV